MLGTYAQAICPIQISCRISLIWWNGKMPSNINSKSTVKKTTHQMQMLRVQIWIFTRSIWFFCDFVHRDWLWYMRHRTKMNWHHYIWAVSFSIETSIVSKPTMKMSIIELLQHQTYRVNIVLIFKRRQASHKFNRDNSTKKKD